MILWTGYIFLDEWGNKLDKSVGITQLFSSKPIKSKAPSCDEAFVTPQGFEPWTY